MSVDSLVAIEAVRSVLSEPTELSKLLSVPLSPPEAYHSTFWFCFSFILWVVLHIFVTPIYATIGDGLHALWRLVRPKSAGSSQVLYANELSWGTRFTQAYNMLSTSKKAYWRRLFRSFIYYFTAVWTGFYFICSYYRSIVDLYFIYTPGKSKCEQLAVFWGYIFHHLLTAGAYLMAVHTQQLGIMCLMGLTFEGPVFFGCLREIVSLYDEDFNLFDRVPPMLMKMNWICAFASLVPCRYVSVIMFFYSAMNWRDYLQLVEPSVRACYWGFGSTFLFINVYFTWLLNYWHGQDQRYLKKKRQKAAMALEQTKQQHSESHTNEHDQLLPSSPTGSSPGQSPLATSHLPIQRYAASVHPVPTDNQPVIQIVAH